MPSPFTKRVLRERQAVRQGLEELEKCGIALSAAVSDDCGGVGGDIESFQNPPENHKKDHPDAGLDVWHGAKVHAEALLENGFVIERCL